MFMSRYYMCRMDTQTKLSTVSVSKQQLQQQMLTKNPNGGPSLNNVDKDMLTMALSMLRCSICKDKFKNVVLTRCYHLFCKDCIDDSLKVRNRKCPACGEKFGQDDVRPVYFNH